MPEGDGAANPQAGNGAGQGTGGANPQAGNGAPAVNPQAGNSGSGNPQQPQMSLDDALEALRKERLANADARTKLKRLDELEAAHQASENAKLSETEKLTKRIAELERAAADTLRSTQERIVRAEIKAAAGAVGIKADLAARLIDYAEIEFADDGEPKNVVKLLEKLAGQYPELVQVNGQNGAASQSQPPAAAARPPVTAGGATNPGRSAGNGGLTLDIIKAMPIRERVARIEEIQAWEKAQTQTR